MKRLDVSVIVPCHNQACWLTESLRSVQAQTVPPREVIVIDDASTDDIAGAIAASELTVKLLPASVRNAGVARNIGIEAASGEWVAFLDADDVWYPHHLEEAANQLCDGGDVAYMANHHFMFGDRIEPISGGIRPKISQTKSGLSHTDFIELLGKGFHFGHSTVMANRQRVLELGGFDADLKRRHDMDLWLRVIWGHTWTWQQRPAAQYRVDTPESICKDKVRCERDYLTALLKNEEIYDGEPMRHLIKTSARRAMGLAFVDGVPSEFPDVRRLAWDRLDSK